MIGGIRKSSSLDCENMSVCTLRGQEPGGTGFQETVFPDKQAPHVWYFKKASGNSSAEVKQQINEVTWLKISLFLGEAS